MIRFFTTHPNNIGETYFQHLKFATYFGFNLMVGGIACLIHAIFPFLFQNTGTNALFKMMHFYLGRMPHIEERMVQISATIVEKIEDTSDVSKQGNMYG